MVQASDIREQLRALLFGLLGLESFENWISVHTWNIHRWGDSEAQDLAYSIELRLSEYSSGHLPWGQMSSEFEKLAWPEADPVIFVDSNVREYRIQTGSATPTPVWRSLELAV